MTPTADKSGIKSFTSTHRYSTTGLKMYIVPFWLQIQLSRYVNIHTYIYVGMYVESALKSIRSSE